MRVICLLVLVVPGFLLAQGFQAGPTVDAKLLQGRRLILPETKCSVEAPSDDWEWLESTGPYTRGKTFFVAMRGTFVAYGVMPVPGGAKLDDSFMNKLKRMTEQHAEAGQRKLEAFDHQPMDAPAGSYRYSYKITAPSGDSLLTFGYAVPCSGRVLLLDFVGARTEEPTSFRQLARSVRVKE